MKSIPQLLTALALAVAGALSLTTAPSTLAAESDDIAALIEQAETARQRAAELEYEWRFTGKHIKEAREALAANDLTTARAKAERALFEAERAIEQAAISESVWMLAVPK